jgi:peptide chain release factor 2
MKEKTALEGSIARIVDFEKQVEDALVNIELGIEMEDEATTLEGEENLLDLQTQSAKKRLESLLSGEADPNNAFLEVHAGAGGTEAQDWAEMLVRMYTRYADSRGYGVEWLEESPGDEAGIKSVTLKITGDMAYGWLKTESGVHRLVRISPFDANSKRHTSFASAWIYPEVDDSIEVDIQEKDLRIDTYRASGAGGQHVNKTESAIRITHIPTGIVVTCQNDRSQHRNRAQAMSMLKARIYEMELRKQEEALQSENDLKSQIGWGHQIRSYVLHPYQMVKDLRTGFEKGNALGVLDGDIEGFLEASLTLKLK